MNKFPYVEGQIAEMFYDGKWKRGRIYAGYRFRDGIVTIVTDDGEKISCGEARTDLYREVKQEENNMEKFINEKATQMIEELRTKMRNNNMELTNDMEYLVRIGMGYGLSLAAMGLANLPTSVALGEEMENK